MRRWLLGIALAGMMLTACSDDSGSAASTTAAATTSASATSTLPASTTTTTTAPEPDEVLYYASEGRLFRVVPGEAPELLADGPFLDQPAPSPDGERLAFVRLDGEFAGELWIANADGTDARLLVPIGVSEDPASSEGEPAAAFRPVWSPDSSQIAFMRTIGLDGGDLYVADPDSGAVVTPDPPLWVSSFSWGADSESIAYVSGTNDVSPVDIGVLDLTTLETRPLVEATAAYGGVAVTPDGDEVVFVNSQLPLPPEDAAPFELFTPGIYEVPFDGGDPETVAPDPDPDDYRWAVRDTAGCLVYARQFNEGIGEVLLHRLCAGDPEPATPVTNLALFPAAPAVAESTAIAYLVEGDNRALFVIPEPGADPVPIDEGVTAFAWS
jgi:dipeptidyl aminopeptidase/acylaminoacyl peptidase